MACTTYALTSNHTTGARTSLKCIGLVSSVRQTMLAYSMQNRSLLEEAGIE